MRKRVKTITEHTHEYGTIAIEHSLLDKLLGYASLDDVSTEHIDLMLERTMKISEEIDGEPVTTAEHIVPITAGTPAAADAVVTAEKAT
jgi:hypothetical protein